MSGCFLVFPPISSASTCRPGRGLPAHLACKPDAPEVLVLVDQPALDQLFLALVLVQLWRRGAVVFLSLSEHFPPRLPDFVPPLLVLVVLFEQPDFEHGSFEVDRALEGHVAEAVDARDLLRERERAVVPRRREFPGALVVVRVGFLSGSRCYESQSQEKSGGMRQPSQVREGQPGELTQSLRQASPLTMSWICWYVSALAQYCQTCLTLTSLDPSFFAASSSLSPIKVYGRWRGGIIQLCGTPFLPWTATYGVVRIDWPAIVDLEQFRDGFNLGEAELFERALDAEQDVRPMARSETDLPFVLHSLA